jgi:peptidoglycan/LPS O-acetylase OafA/YrhL
MRFRSEVSPHSGAASRGALASVWILIAAAGFASEALATGGIGPVNALGYGLAMPNAYKFIWGYSLLNVGFALLIQHVERKDFGHAVLELRTIRYLGRISYGF